MGLAEGITNPALEALIERALHHKMTPREVFEQRVSFVWGMLDSKNPLTKDDVRRMLTETQGSPA